MTDKLQEDILYILSALHKQKYVWPDRSFTLEDLLTAVESIRLAVVDTIFDLDWTRRDKIALRKLLNEEMGNE